MCLPPVVVCNDEHRFMVAEQLRSETNEQATLILEPAGRNKYAPAIALAALHAASAPGGIVVGASRRPSRDRPRGVSENSRQALLRPRRLGG